VHPLQVDYLNRSVPTWLKYLSHLLILFCDVRESGERGCFVFQIEDDAYQEDLGFSLGTMGKSKSGRIRGPIVDSKTKARMSKTLQVRKPETL